MKKDKYLSWIGKNWIQYIRDNHKSYYKELKKEGSLNRIALEKEKAYEKNLETYKNLDLPPGGAEELAREDLYC